MRSRIPCPLCTTSGIWTMRVREKQQRSIEGARMKADAGKRVEELEQKEIQNI